MSSWIRFNPNPVGNRVEDCAQRAIAAALDVDWDTASDLIYEMAKGMGTTTHDDAAWGAVLRRAGFVRAVNGRNPADILPWVDELMGTLQLIHPRLYDAAMRKLQM